MADDGEVKIDTKLDTDGIDKGLKDLKVKLNNLGAEIDKDTNKEKNFNKELDNTADAANKAGNEIDKTKKKHKGFGDILKDVKGKISGTTIAGVAATVAIKKTVDALNDCAAAYRKQINAEESLQLAAKNNPYLNNESVYNLKQFASELQGLSEIGDEVSLQVMAQLAAAGRNEEQIVQIMSAAADMAAVTGDDIATAALQLNATLNGNAGALGRQIGAISNLTKEELENGKAIELVAKQYKGAAAATADVEVQLSNAWGDFKENIGRGWQNVTQPVKQFFLDVLNDINEATSKTAALKTAKTAAATGKETAADAKLLLDEAQAVLDQMDANKGLSERKGGIMAGYQVDQNWQKNRDEQQKKVEELTRRYNFLASSERYEAAEAERNAKKAADAAAKRAEAETRDKDAADFIKANQKALAEQIKAMELKADLTGKEIDAGEMYNAYLSSYIDLVTKSNGLVTENNTAAKARLALLKKWAEKAQAATTAEERLAAAQELQTITDEVNNKPKTTVDEYEEKNKKLDDYAARVQEMADKELITEQQKTDALLKIDEAYAQNKKDLWHDIADEVNNTTQQMAQYAQQMGDLMLEGVQAQTDAELAALEEKYSKGEVSEEQYYEKQKEIKKKAAQDEYKIAMFQWQASILAATANIAEGVSKAIAQGGVGGLITGALVGAAGAVQIASIIASKPIPPSFATGGVVGGMNGASMGGDNTYIHARVGEMILNASQQRALWDKLNGQTGRDSGGLNLTVNNTQAGRVRTDVRQQPNGDYIIDILDKQINKGLSNGNYDAGFAAMNTRNEGVRIL
jgi:hypothetical protein